MENRIIKFRAWDKTNKAMAIFQLGTFEGGKLLFREPFVLESLCFDCYEKKLTFDSKQTRDNYELMQFTGLKDKNGNEIYEGDIIKASVGNREVKWLSVGWSSLLLRTESVEIIGNIFEDKDLLK